MSKEEIMRPAPIKEEREAKLKEKADKYEKRSQEKEEKKLKWEQEKERSKSEQPKKQQQLKSLFVRNIGFETTEEQFKDFMAVFGELKYAVLCKMGGFNLNEDGDDKSKATHKGTGFVQYKDEKIATELVELSKQIET